MTGNVDKAVDMLKQLLADDDAKEKLSSVLTNVISEKQNDNEPLDADITELSDEEGAMQSAETQSNADFSSGGDIMNFLANMGSDKRVTLLNALKPYLSLRRSEKLDGAITILKMAEISSSMGLTKLFK